MNLLKILNDIDKAGPEFIDRIDSRREAFKQISAIGKKVALTAIPLGFSSIFTDAKGQSNAGIAGALNYALTLAFLEAEFYRAAIVAADNNALVFPTVAARTAIITIRDHKLAHVNVLRDSVIGVGGTPVAFTGLSFDFTAGGMYANVFSDYAMFLTVAQTLKDTTVRAFKGRLVELKSHDHVLRIALQLHSADARHASHIRQMRQSAGAPDIMPWITGNEANGAEPAVYVGEEETMQLGVDITGLPGAGGNISTSSATEAFDEPLTEAQVLAIIGPFFV